MLNVCIFKNTEANVYQLNDPYSHISWEIAESLCLSVIQRGYGADTFGTLATVFDKVISQGCLMKW
jgi:hypothetical protein